MARYPHTDIGASVWLYWVRVADHNGWMNLNGWVGDQHKPTSSDVASG